MNTFDIKNSIPLEKIQSKKLTSTSFSNRDLKGYIQDSNKKLDILKGKLNFERTIQQKFITKLMVKGKKELSEQILLKALKKVEQELLKNKFIKSENIGFETFNSLKKDFLEDKTFSNQVKVEGVKQIKKKKDSESNDQNKVVLVNNISLYKLLYKIIQNAKPLVRLKKVRIAGTTHQKPVGLTKKQAETDAIKRIILNANARSEKSIVLKLAKEFEEIYCNLLSNKTLTEVRDLHKLAEINKANVTLKS